MRGNHRTKNPRSGQLLVDVLHILICILIVILAVLAFLNPAGHTMVYPVIFFLSFLLNGIEAAGKLKRNNRGKKQLAAGISFSLMTAVLLVLTAVSAVSVWR